MNIFNSLGSNYDLKFVFSSLFTVGSNKDHLELTHFLEKKYNGRALLLYKGREALTLALGILKLPQKTEVAINGFTCFAVHKAVEEAGHTPICLDLDSEKLDLNFTSKELEKALKNPNLKVVVVQNTLGYPCDIDAISTICKKNKVFLIEDLAHCVGARYPNGKEVGTVGDFVVLSFSQDKIIDSVSGGALVIRNKKYTSALDLVGAVRPTYEVGFKQQLIDRLYPLFTYKIRKTYRIGVGKLLHFLLKKTNVLSKPMSESFYAKYHLPDRYARLAMDAFIHLNTSLKHRNKIANIYNSMLDKKIASGSMNKNIMFSSNLRYPIFVENRNSLINYLEKEGVYVSDIWYYDVSPDCPNAQKISSSILNLPTHINMSENNAKLICERINRWVNLH